MQDNGSRDEWNKRWGWNTSWFNTEGGSKNPREISKIEKETEYVYTLNAFKGIGYRDVGHSNGKGKNMKFDYLPLIHN